MGTARDCLYTFTLPLSKIELLKCCVCVTIICVFLSLVMEKTAETSSSCCVTLTPFFLHPLIQVQSQTPFCTKSRLTYRVGA